MSPVENLAERFVLDDLIGYFVPGLLAVAAINELLWPWPEQIPHVHELGTVTIGFLVIAASYSAGVVIGACSRFAETFVYRRVVMRGAGIPPECWPRLAVFCYDSLGLPPVRPESVRNKGTTAELNERELIVRVCREALRIEYPRADSERRRYNALAMLARNLLLPLFLWAAVVWITLHSPLFAVIGAVGIGGILIYRWQSLEERAIRLIINSYLITRTNQATHRSQVTNSV